MKRLLLSTLVAVVCTIGYAQKVTIDGITYSIKNGVASVVGIENNVQDVIILDKVTYNGQNYPVTAIKRTGLMSGSSGGLISSLVTKENVLRTLSIPNSVKSIQRFSFTYCKKLYKLILPDEPIDIAANAFGECVNLTEVQCQNGSFPTYALSSFPKDRSVLIAQISTMGGTNSNSLYAQPAQQPAVSTAPQQAKKPSSDVDVNLPSNTISNENTFAVIFANEKYQEEVDVEYAENDGEMFKEYCNKVLGIPEDNIHLRKNATKNNMIAEISWMKKVADAYSGQARFIVFYAGHGIPDEKTGSAYLLPVDGVGTEPETAYSLAQFYKTLGSLPVANVTVFMDACFSGSKRGEGMLASARGVAIKAKAQAPQGKMVVFSAAQGDETAYPFKEKEHGLFTYYLLKKLKETKGNVTYGELGTYLQTEVKRKSIVANSKSQTPTVSSSQSVANSWKSMKLK